MTARIHDVTRPLTRATPVWPGDAPLELRWTARLDGDGANVGALRMSTHCGTHVDAPYHVLGEGARTGALPPGTFIGPALLVEVGDRLEIGPDVVEDALGPGGVERLLFRTGCAVAGALPERFPPLAPAAARRIVAAGVRLVGTDAPSVDPADSAALPAHRVLAAAGIPILENLWLEGVGPGWYELIALPLRLEDGDASPVRAVLREP